MILLASQPINRSGQSFASSNLIPTMLDGSHTYQAADMSVTQSGDTYTASFAGGDASDSLWFNTSEGRLDYVTFTGDFEVEASNIGLVTGATDGEVQFCGLCVWLSSLNYEFIVAGNRGAGRPSTVEYKATVAGVSDVDDTGSNSITAHKSDLRVKRVGSTVTFDRKAVGAETWVSVPMGNLSPRVNFGAGAVRVGIVTYGFSTVTAFTSSCDSVVATIGTAS